MSTREQRQRLKRYYAACAKARSQWAAQGYRGKPPFTPPLDADLMGLTVWRQHPGRHAM